MSFTNRRFDPQVFTITGNWNLDGPALLRFLSEYFQSLESPHAIEITQAVGINGTPIGDETPAEGTFTTLAGSIILLSPPVTETAATHTVAETTTHLIANRAGTITVTLPAAADYPGRLLWVRTITANTVVSDAANVVPKAGGAAGTAILAAAAGNWALLVSDGTNWQVMAGT